jgi:hypothetical protein
MFSFSSVLPFIIGPMVLASTNAVKFTKPFVISLSNGSYLKLTHGNTIKPT